MPPCCHAVEVPDKLTIPYQRHEKDPFFARPFHEQKPDEMSTNCFSIVWISFRRKKEGPIAASMSRPFTRVRALNHFSPFSDHFMFVRRRVTRNESRAVVVNRQPRWVLL